VPIEGALAVALQNDPALTGFATERNVAIATPTTLMLALKTVASLWQVERRNRNADAIAERAGKLYDKFVGFLDDMKSVGERLNQAQASYAGAMDKLSDGKGNLVRQVELLKIMGAKTGKSIPPEHLDSDETEAVVTSPTGVEA
jgi:DNA recombination protein RmuC